MDTVEPEQIGRMTQPQLIELIYRQQETIAGLRKSLTASIKQNNSQKRLLEHLLAKKKLKANPSAQ